MTEEANQGTYVFDAGDPVELGRLINQDQMITRAMGGPFAGLSTEEISRFQTILDLGCGPGGWVLDAAYALLDADVAGVDSSRIMIEYANARARSQGLTNASFGIMDITQPLDFADGTFDLVNARALTGALLQTAWPPFLAECMRILRPGGILRLTEFMGATVSTSAAGEEMARLVAQALWQKGYGFSPDGKGYGIAYMLPRLLRRAGCQNIHHASHSLEVSDDTPSWANHYRNVEVGTLQAKPLLLHVGVTTPEHFDQLYQQIMIDLHAEGFTGMWSFLTAWGQKAV